MRDKQPSRWPRGWGLLVSREKPEKENIGSHRTLPTQNGAAGSPSATYSFLEISKSDNFVLKFP